MHQKLNPLPNQIVDFVDENNWAILTTRNDTCKILNDEILKLIPGEEQTYFSFTKYVENTKRVRGINEEYLDNYSNPSLPDSVITLKVGTLIMLTVNLNPANSLMNGTKLRVKQLFKSYILCEIVSECKHQQN